MQLTAISGEQLAEELDAFIAVAGRSGRDEAFRLAAELQLSLSQLRALWVLDSSDREELALHEVAASAGLSAPSACRTVDQLVRAGFVTRREDDADRRIKRIAMTRRGHDVVRRFTEVKRERLREFAAGLSDEERRALSAAMAPVLARDAGVDS